MAPGGGCPGGRRGRGRGLGTSRAVAVDHPARGPGGGGGAARRASLGAGDGSHRRRGRGRRRGAGRTGRAAAPATGRGGTGATTQPGSDAGLVRRRPQLALVDDRRRRTADRRRVQPAGRPLSGPHTRHLPERAGRRRAGGCRTPRRRGHHGRLGLPTARRSDVVRGRCRRDLRGGGGDQPVVGTAGSRHPRGLRGRAGRPSRPGRPGRGCHAATGAADSRRGRVGRRRGRTRGHPDLRRVRPRRGRRSGRGPEQCTPSDTDPIRAGPLHPQRSRRERSVHDQMAQDVLHLYESEPWRSQRARPYRTRAGPVGSAGRCVAASPGLGSRRTDVGARRP